MENNLIKERKVNEAEILMKFEDFGNIDTFTNKLSKVLSINKKHSILLRVSYKSEDNISKYKMLGHQININVGSHIELLEEIVSLHDVITARLDKSMDDYDYTPNSLMIIQLIVYVIGTYERKTREGLKLSSLGESSDLINSKKIKEEYKLLPITHKKSDYGVKLKVSSRKGYVSDVTFSDGSVVKFIDNINKYSREKISFSSKCVFYEKDNTIIVIDNVTKNKKIINSYHKNGMFMYSTTEEDFGSYYTRSSGNIKFYKDKSGVFRKDISINLSPVYPYKIGGKLATMSQPDYRFGTLDLETYNKDNISKVYAAGFYTNNKLNIYYIEDNLDSDQLIMKCLDNMLVNTYKGYIFYVHNLSRFDIYFIFKILLSNPSKYGYKPVWRDNELIGITISKKVNNKTYSIKLVDSANILKAKLSKLCKTFNTNTVKTNFPYSFVNKNNLFYIGNKPDISYYENISLEDYSEIPTSNWDLKLTTEKYLKNDLISLFEVMNKFNNTIFRDYHVHVTNSLTISSLSMDIFLRKYYNKDIPLIKEKSMYKDIKQGYYGGVTEVYRPYGQDLYHYDVNSLYPFAALNDMPGLNCTFTDNIDKNIKDLKDIFGFYYCEIISPENDYLGLLPVRFEDRLVMGLGYMKGWYFSEELKFASDNGYDIKVISGYTFDKSKNVFNNYIESLYNIKRTTTDEVERQTVKSLLNNLLGRFGLDINKYVTSVVTREQLVELLKYKNVKSAKYMDDITFETDSSIDDLVIVNHSKDISFDACQNSGLNYEELFYSQINSNNKSVIEDNYHDVSVVIAAAITSYARVFMSKIQLDILRKGGKMYYKDTDCIVTDIPLDDHLIGDGLGQFKLEHEIIEGYYISNKTYAIKVYDNKLKREKVLIKAKGIDSNNLVFDNFKTLHSGESITGNKFVSERSFSLGSVNINKAVSTKLNPFSYTKRLKIMDSNNTWVDTKPIKFNKYHTLTTFIYKRGFKMYLGSLVFIVLLYILYNLVDLNTIDNTLVGMDILTTEVFIDDFTYDNYSNNKNIFSKFIDLFNKPFNKSNFYTITKDVINKDSILNIKSVSTDSRIEIMDRLYRYNLEVSDIEIQQLKEKIARLEYRCIRHRIDKLDLINDINQIITGFENDLNIRINKPSYVTRFSPWNSPLTTWKTPISSPRIG